MRKNRILITVTFIALALILSAGTVWALGVNPRPVEQRILAQLGEPSLEWFGWSHFRITDSDGTVILLNPFITGNPDASTSLDAINKVDFILVPNGHGDEIGDTIAIAKKTGAKVIAGGFEMGSWFIEKGIPASQVIRSNPGNIHRLGKITVRVVNSLHGSGLPEPTEKVPYGGPAAGFFITLSNGFTVYFAGSTAVTSDMTLWSELYKPDLAILPLGNNRDPMDVGMMVRLLLKGDSNLKRVLPHHHRVVHPEGATTIDEMEAAIGQLAGGAVSVVRPVRGDSITLSK